MNEVIETEVNIEDLIYEIRGKQVMLGSDLARLYKCKNGTKEINQTVKNNIEKFPERFSWIIDDIELEELRSKFLTTNYNKMSRTNPRVFTEQGVAMLASVIKTKIASKISIDIMRAFVSMKKFISSNLIEQKYINNLVLEDHDKIKILQESFDKLSEKRKSNIDDKEVYHCGASINRIGYKTFSITLMNDKEITCTLINKIKMLTHNKKSNKINM